MKRVTKRTKSTNDLRFRKKEKAINEAFFRRGGKTSVTDLTKEAGIARSTFYQHHNNTQSVMPDLEQKTLEDYGTEVVLKGLKSGVRVQILYMRMLSFIRAHRQNFQAIMKLGNDGVITEMVAELMPKISKVYRLPEKYREVTQIYEKEVMAVVEFWIEKGFSTSEIGVLKDIMFLTRSARKRLLAIGK